MRFFACKPRIAIRQSMFSNALSEVEAKHIKLSTTKRETLSWLALRIMQHGTICLWRLAANVASTAQTASVRRRFYWFFQHARLDEACWRRVWWPSCWGSAVSRGSWPSLGRTGISVGFRKLAYVGASLLDGANARDLSWLGSPVPALSVKTCLRSFGSDQGHSGLGQGTRFDPHGPERQSCTDGTIWRIVDTGREVITQDAARDQRQTTQ
jgi:hypothetical protein